MSGQAELDVINKKGNNAKEEVEFDPTIHRTVSEGRKRKGIEWSGIYYKVKVFNEAYNPKGGMHEFGLGDFPKFYVAPNVECIMPIEIYNLLVDTTTEVIDCDMDNARQGQRVEYGTRINVRIPFQFLGIATEAEYKAQMKAQRELPPYRPLK